MSTKYDEVLKEVKGNDETVTICHTALVEETRLWACQGFRAAQRQSGSYEPGTGFVAGS